MGDFRDRVAALREAAPKFEATLAQLRATIPAMQSHPQGSADLRVLLNDGQAIRAGIANVTKLIDTSKKFVDKTFQTDAMETIPFADQIVSTAAAGSVSAINAFQDRARSFLARAQRRLEHFASLTPEQRKGLSETEAVLPEIEVTASRLPFWGPIAFIALLGGLYWFYHYGRTGEPNFRS